MGTGLTGALTKLGLAISANMKTYRSVKRPHSRLSLPDIIVGLNDVVAATLCAADGLPCIASIVYRWCRTAMRMASNS